MCKSSSMTTQANSKTGVSTASRENERYFNIAAITVDGRTITSQVWTRYPDEVLSVLLKWCSPEQERFYGEILNCVMFDSASKTLRQFVRREDGSLSERTESAYKRLICENNELRNALRDIKGDANAQQLSADEKIAVIKTVLDDVQ